jgi:hypothetical protein
MRGIWVSGEMINGNMKQMSASSLSVQSDEAMTAYPHLSSLGNAPELLLT